MYHHLRLFCRLARLLPCSIYCTLLYILVPRPYRAVTGPAPPASGRVMEAAPAIGPVTGASPCNPVWH